MVLEALAKVLMLAVLEITSFQKRGVSAPRGNPRASRTQGIEDCLSTVPKTPLNTDAKPFN